MFVFHIWLAIILVVANQVEGFLSLSKVRMRTTALRETPTEAEVWLEDLFDFTVEALPELLAPMSWSGDAASIRLNPPKFRKVIQPLVHSGQTFSIKHLLSTNPRSVVPHTYADTIAFKP